MENLLSLLTIVPAEKGLWQPLMAEFAPVFPGVLFAEV